MKFKTPGHVGGDQLRDARAPDLADVIDPRDEEIPPNYPPPSVFKFRPHSGLSVNRNTWPTREAVCSTWRTAKRYSPLLGIVHSDSCLGPRCLRQIAISECSAHSASLHWLIALTIRS
jgi:hypothetical protein